MIFTITTINFTSLLRGVFTSYYLFSQYVIWIPVRNLFIPLSVFREHYLIPAWNFIKIIVSVFREHYLNSSFGILNHLIGWNAWQPFLGFRMAVANYSSKRFKRIRKNTSDWTKQLIQWRINRGSMEPSNTFSIAVELYDRNIPIVAVRNYTTHEQNTSGWTETIVNGETKRSKELLVWKPPKLNGAKTILSVGQ